MTTQAIKLALEPRSILGKIVKQLRKTGMDDSGESRCPGKDILHCSLDSGVRRNRPCWLRPTPRGMKIRATLDAA